MHVAIGVGPGLHGLLGDEVHQIVDVEHVAAGEDAGHGGLQLLVHHGAGGAGGDLHAGHLGELVLRDQAHGQQQGVAGEILFRAGNGLEIGPDLGHGDALEVLAAVDVHDGVAQEQGDAEVVQALDDVPLEAAGVGHQLHAGVDLGAQEGHAAGHDEADVAGAQDDHLFAGHDALQIGELLGGAGGEDAGAALAGGAQGAPGPLAAAHAEDHGLGLNLLEAVLPGHAGDHLVGGHVDDHGLGLIGDLIGQDLFDEPLGVLGAGQLLLEGVEAEAVVDALLEDAAQPLFTVQDQDVAGAGFIGADRRSQARRAAADDENIRITHCSPSSKRYPSRR